MSLMNINFVIASKDPKGLSNFYGKINSDKVIKGFNSNHYFISLSNRSKIDFFRPGKNYEWTNKGNSASLCFEGKPSIEPLKAIQTWSMELLELGGNVKSSPRLEEFGAELWMLDPEGNHFLILVPFFKNVI